MITRKYLKYNDIDFSKDENFIRWVLYPNEEDDLYWNNFILANPDKIEDIEKAKDILKKIRINKFQFTPSEKEIMLGDITHKITIHKRRRKMRIAFLIAAAACIACITVFNSPFLSIKSIDDVTAIANDIPDSERGDDIQLILGNNESVNFKQNVVIKYDESGQVTVSAKNKEIKSIDVKSKDIQWNKLIVPRGKRSFILLPDKSKIWINSGSTLEFPTTFAKDKRQIRVDGEIYIEVEKDANSPFYVSLNTFEVKVLGTRFNISAYSDDPLQYVVLVEGSVNVTSDKGKSYPLKPDQLLSINQGQYNIKNNVDVYDYISWKDGLLQFKGQSLPVILNQLSRYYDIPIKCEYSLEKIRCSGKLILFPDIDAVLETVSDIVPIEWSMKDNVLVINKKK